MRVLASHPATLLDLRDASGATALDAACTRLLVGESLPLEQKSLCRQVIARALDERCVLPFFIGVETFWAKGVYMVSRLVHFLV